MAEVRMTLKDAADALGMKPNGVRSRFLSNKIRGERDNMGKIWVWIDTEAANDERLQGEASKVSEPLRSNPSKPSSEGYEAFEIKALQGAVEALSQQLAQANAEKAALQEKADLLPAIMAEVASLKASNEGLQGQLDIRIEQLAELRRLMAEAQEKNAAELQRWMQAQPAKGFFARLFGRS